MQANEAGAALNAQIEHLLIVDAAPIAIIMTDDSGQIVLVNQEAESLFGWSRRELLGHPIEALVPDQARARHPELRSAYLKKPESRLMGVGRELHALAKSGVKIPVEIGLRPIQAGDQTFVLSTIVDVTERKRHEQSVARLAAIVESARVAIIAYSVDGVITDWNPAAEQLYGFSADEMIGKKSILDVAPPELQAEALEVLERIKGGKRVDSLETERLKKSGGKVRVSLAASPIRARGGEVIGISSIGHDLSQRVALEEQLREANQKLAERTERLASQARELKDTNLALELSNQELQEFAYVASHDLQAPLRTINSFLQLLEEEYSDRLDAQGRDWIGHALNSVEKLQSLISDLLSYARVDSRGHPFVTVDLAKVFDDTAELLARQVGESGATLTRGELPIVEGDVTQLARVFENLIDNALKYRGHEPPLIHISAEDNEDSWRFSVRDNGIGIDPEFHDQIFDVFRRLHTDRVHPGTGIGLAICRRVIKRHGGAIWLKSSEGQGSTFFFTLPKL